MGFNTTVLILNDGFDFLEHDPEAFIAGVKRTMRDGGTVGVGGHANVVEVMPTAHADMFRLYTSHANMMLELSKYNRKTMELAARMPELVRENIRQARYMLDELEEAMNDA